MSKKLVFMRTHMLETYILSEYEKLMYSLEPDDECLLFIDNSKNLLPKQQGSPISTININGLNVKNVITTAPPVISTHRANTT